MAAWTADELAKIGQATELQIASRRSDGSLRPYVTIWVVRSGDDLYVRSAYRHDNGWFQRALSSGEGRIRAGVVERHVTFEEPGAAVDAALHAAYHAKYDRYVAPTIRVGSRPKALSHARFRPAGRSSGLTQTCPFEGDPEPTDLSDLFELLVGPRSAGTRGEVVVVNLGSAGIAHLLIFGANDCS